MTGFLAFVSGFSKKFNKLLWLERVKGFVYIIEQIRVYIKDLFNRQQTLLHNLNISDKIPLIFIVAKVYYFLYHYHLI